MSAHELVLHSQVDDFLIQTQPYLELHEAENSLILGALLTWKRTGIGANRFMAFVKDEAARIKCVAFARDKRLFLSRGDTGAVVPLADHLASRQPELPGIVGLLPVVDRFAEIWQERVAVRPEIAMEQGLYELRELIHPTGVPGRARLISPRDRETMREWIYSFHHEAEPLEPYDRKEAYEAVERMLAAQSTFVWDLGSKIVATASLTRPTPNGISVNAVYTPPDQRGRGYASAVTASASQSGLERGKKFCVLYTDMKNPTSNSIYQKIGYRKIASSRNYRFVTTDPGGKPSKSS